MPQPRAHTTVAMGRFKTSQPRVDPVDPDPDPDPVPVTISNDEPGNNFAAAWQGSAVWAMHPNPVWAMLPINAPSSDRH